MGKFARGFCWLLAFWCLAFNLYTWGGLAVTPTIGKHLRQQASMHSPLAATYLFAGGKAVDAAGQSRKAMDHAARRFPAQVADLESPRQTIVERFVSAQSASARLAYYGAPWFLVLSLVLHARRPKRIRSFGVRD